VDFIKAAKEFLSDSIPFSHQLFLAGYSEGGYVTMAAMENIVKNPLPGLTLKAVAAGAGGYELTKMLDMVTSNNTYTYPAYLSFVIESFDSTYSWGRKPSYYYTPVYATKFPALLDGTKSGSEINAQLTNNLDSLFNPGFYRALQNHTDSLLNSALEKNTISAWADTIPLRFYHGTNDEIIPISNSQDIYNAFLVAGSITVSFVAIPGGTHESSFKPMLADMLTWFKSL
jgi:pimeloyl-ACP methyl ester carboxylesterase